MKHEPNALSEIEQALNLLGETIEVRESGLIAGMDAVYTGLRAMASTLAYLYDFPRALNDKAPLLDEVASYLSYEKTIDPEAPKKASELQALLRRARYTYNGVSADDVKTAEVRRRELHGYLRALQANIKREFDHD
jgi:hypothetical protein